MTEQTEDSGPQTEAAAADVEFISAERVIFFSDAVVAIAITLLALGLPDVHGTSNTAVLHSLHTNRNAYLPFLISFIVIAAYWRAHHRLYSYVARLDATLVTINLAWLLMIICTPYATRVLSGGPFGGVRFSLYAGIQVITMVTMVIMGRHIRAAGLLRADAPPAARSHDISVVAVAITFAVSIPIAFIPGVGQWAYAVWMASALAARTVRRARGRLAAGS
jgi:uncharacterized membrane protein